MSSLTKPSSFTPTLALGEAKRGAPKRRVIVTGSSGKLGRSTVAYLANEGWEVIGVDTRRPPGASEDGKLGLGGAYRLVEIDLEDMGSVLETFMTTDMAYTGIDAVVHLAAIPSPGQTNASRQFRTNTMRCVGEARTSSIMQKCGIVRDWTNDRTLVPTMYSRRVANFASQMLSWLRQRR